MIFKRPRNQRGTAASELALAAGFIILAATISLGATGGNLTQIFGMVTSCVAPELAAGTVLMRPEDEIYLPPCPLGEENSSKGSEPED